MILLPRFCCTTLFALGKSFLQSLINRRSSRVNSISCKSTAKNSGNVMPGVQQNQTRHNIQFSHGFLCMVCRIYKVALICQMCAKQLSKRPFIIHNQYVPVQYRHTFHSGIVFGKSQKSVKGDTFSAPPRLCYFFLIARSSIQPQLPRGSC